MRFFGNFLLICILSGTNIPGFPAGDKTELTNAVRLIDSLNNLSTQFSLENARLSMSYASQALNLSKSCRYQEGEARALYLSCIGISGPGGLSHSVGLLFQEHGYLPEIK